jgi:3-dehydroquinate synthase
VLDALVRDEIETFRGRRVAVISDDNVAPLHGERVAQAMRDARVDAALLAFPAGEASKRREIKADLEDRLAEDGFGRDTVIVAVGGGVVGDLAGFLAATWQRGVPVVQVPTSLLAMVDAAIGGKTAVNLPAGKNLVGSFHQPHAVWADLAVLSTLPDENYVDGFAEVVKSAVIADAGLFAWLETTASRLAARETSDLERVVVACMRVKGAVVQADEREAGRRAMLNFGHTAGHALEAASAYRVRHGQAVALGMCAEARLAREWTGFPADHVRRLEGLLDALSLPTRLDERPDADAVLAAASRDKKARRGRTRCALPLEIGRMAGSDDVTVEIEARRVVRALEELAGEGPAF